MSNAEKPFEIPPEYFIEQLSSAISTIETEPVSHNKWINLVSDNNFGCELEYIRRRAFYRKPYIEYGESIVRRGNYSHIFELDCVHLSADVTRMNSKILNMTPLLINGNLYYKWRGANQMNQQAFCREFWRISKNGVSALDIECLEGINVITNVGETFAGYLKRTYFEDCINKTAIIVVATAMIGYTASLNPVTKLNLTVIKPALTED